MAESVPADRCTAVDGGERIALGEGNLPVHWDGLWGAFEAGVPQPYSDPPLDAFLTEAGVQVIKPEQYMDKWRLDRNGIQAVPNTNVKSALGFSSGS